VEQNTPLAGVVNTITVTIKANCDLPAGSKVTIHALTGSASNQAASLALVGGNGGLESKGDWDGSANLTMTSAGMLQHGRYEARFNLTNPETSQSSPQVMISATVKSVYGDMSPVVSTEMFKTGASLLSVTKGLDPLEIHVPTFVVRAIGQSNPVPGSSNFISITLIPSCDFEARSLITISGLTETLTPDVTTDFPVETLSPRGYPQWFSSTSWTQSQGKLFFKLFNNSSPSSRYQMESYIGMTFNTSFVFRFHVRNPLTEQQSPSVNITAAIWSPWGPLYSPINQEMTKESVMRLQVPKASDPLFIWKPVFTIQLMGQSNPLSKATNTLTVTFQTNFEVLPGSNFTITGLTGTMSPNTNRLGVGSGGVGSAPLANPSHSVSKFSADLSPWNQEEGKLTLLVTSSLNAHEIYVVEFEVRNSAVEQTNPPIYLEASWDSNLSSTLLEGRGFLAGTVNKSEMSLAREFRFGIANASLPLLTIFPRFDIKFIRQDYFYPNFTNTISVSLKANCNMTKNTSITILGLTGTQTDSAQIMLLETQDMGEKLHGLDRHQKLITAEVLRGHHFESSADWSQTHGRLVIVVANGTTGRKFRCDGDGKDWPMDFCFGRGTNINTTYEVQFNLTQPVDNADFPRKISIQGFIECGAFDSPVYISQMVQSNATIYDLPGSSAPLFVYQPAILSTVLTQQSPFPGIPNLIQARFTFDIAVVPGARITISGFKSMQTVSTRSISGVSGYRVVNYLPCEIRPLGSFSHQCEFNQGSGEVILSTNGAGTRRHVEYHVNFTLVNPMMSQVSNDLWAMANIPYMEFEKNVMGRSSFGRYPRAINVPITSRIFEVPRKTLLGIQQTFSHRIASVDAETCHIMSAACSLGNMIHTCSFDHDAATEISGCLLQCNTSAAIVGSNTADLRAECCGLQCLENCWHRKLEVTRLSKDLHSSCAGVVDKTCPDGALPMQMVSLTRRMPYNMMVEQLSSNALETSANTTMSSSTVEREHVFEIQIAAVLSPPCLNKKTPWECHNWVNGTLLRNTSGARLTGSVVRRVDLYSGQAIFTDLAIVDAPPGDYKILFYVANATEAQFQGRTRPNLGFQTPGDYKQMPEEERVATLAELELQRAAAQRELNLISPTKYQMVQYQTKIKKLDARLAEISKSFIPKYLSTGSWPVRTFFMLNG
jgi:hypothetical protein